MEEIRNGLFYSFVPKPPSLKFTWNDEKGLKKNLSFAIIHLVVKEYFNDKMYYIKSTVFKTGFHGYAHITKEAKNIAK